MRRLLKVLTVLMVGVVCATGGWVEPELAQPGDPSAQELADAPGPVWRVTTTSGDRYYLFFDRTGRAIRSIELREPAEAAGGGLPPAFYASAWWRVRSQEIALTPDGRPASVTLCASTMQWKADGDRVTLKLVRGDAGWSGTLAYQAAYQVWPDRPLCGQHYSVRHEDPTTERVAAVVPLR